MVADASGLVHVVLRGGGAIATIDPRSATLVDRRHVCPAPRGIEYDASLDTLYVTSARYLMTPEQMAAAPHSGALFAYVPGVKGLADSAFAG